MEPHTVAPITQGQMMAHPPTVAQFSRDILYPILRQEARHLYASLGHALTTSVATCVVITLFVYIFGDFIKEKLPSVSTAMAAAALDYFLAAIIVFTTISAIRWVHSRFYGADSWFVLLKSFGIRETDVERFRLQAAGVMSALPLMIVAVVLHFAVAHLSVIHWIMVPIMVGCVLIVLRLMGQRTSKDDDAISKSNFNESKSPLVAWRLSRLVRTSWRGSLLRPLAALPIIFGAAQLLLGGNTELAYLCSLIGGIILAWTVPLLIDDDLKTTWIERQAAVSHEDWIGAWQSIVARWGIRVFFTTMVLTGLAMIIAKVGSSAKTPMDFAEIIQTPMICGILTSFPVWIAPAFVMQIDGRRPMTNIVMMTLINLFVGTAVIAVPYAAPLIYLIQREAHRYQGGRFARGSYN